MNPLACIPEHVPASTAELPRCGVSLVKDSFAEVSETFEEWLPNGEGSAHVLHERGGVQREEKSRRPIPDKVPGYHVEATFTPPQRAYVGIAIAGLNMLSNGRLLARQGEVVPLAARVTDAFLSQQPHNAHFGDAVAKGMLGILNDFGTHYPNLTPALRAMSAIGGIEGLTVAHGAVRGELGRMIANETFMSPARYLHRSASRQEFLGTHPRLAPPPRQYEVWCPGESFAKSLIRQSQQAAEALTDQEQVRLTYNPQLHGMYDGFRLEPALRQKINAVYEAALPESS